MIEYLAGHVKDACPKLTRIKHNKVEKAMQIILVYMETC